MEFSVWAELQGISYKTAWRMWKAKTLPVPAYQLATGTVVVDAKPKSGGVALYARVSSNVDILPHLGLRPPLAREGGRFLRCYA